MQLIRAKSAGFCMGVSLALRALDAVLAEGAKGRIFTHGPIIHNPLVIADYAAKGVIGSEDPSAAGPGDMVIIRAHGVPREVEERLHASGADIRDATCPKVKKAQLAIAEQSAQGRTLLLFGETDHPEVRGLISYAGNRAKIFGSLAELEGIYLNPTEDWFLAAQTTQEQTAFERAAEIVRRRLGRDIPVPATICAATRTRQEEAEALAARVEAMVVVGGKNSGNTRRLAEVAAARCPAVLHVEQADELDPTFFAGRRRVGLTAGASTPERHIAEVEARLLAFAVHFE